MPELPEVEVTRRQLAPLLIGRRIREVVTTPPSYFFLTPPSELARRLCGREVRGLERTGKYLVATLDDGERLLLHLGMTGQIFGAGARSVRLLRATAAGGVTPERQARGFSPDAHTHLRIRFADGGPDVLFRDVRKFGKVQLLRRGERCPRLERLGDDALRARPERLLAATRRRLAPVKTVLLDQSLLAGVGNIYADEALFIAGIAPTRPAGRMGLERWQRLTAALKRVLRRSIRTGGSSISDFVRPDGSDGRYQDERRAYGRTGAPCPACRTPIRRIVLAARATHFCPRCQR